MQAQALAPAHAHAHLQPVEPIQPMHPLAVDQPALTAQKNVNAQVAEARPIQRQLANAHAQRRLILRMGTPIPGRAA